MFFKTRSVKKLCRALDLDYSHYMNNLSELAEKTAERLRVLYNRSERKQHWEEVLVGERTIYVDEPNPCGSSGSSLWGVVGEVTIPIYERRLISTEEVLNPDYESIIKIIRVIPKTMLQDIRILSGALKEKAELWPTDD